MRSRKRTLAALVLAALSALAAALATSGCGSGAVTLDPVAQAAEATTNAGGAQVTIDGTVEGPALPGKLTLKGGGTMSLHQLEGEMTMTVDGLPAKAAAVLPGGQIAMDERFTGGSIYIASPLFAGKLPGGAKWIELNVSKLSSSLGIDAQSLTSGESDPTEMLKLLRGHGATITKLGSEAVRGTQTTHYRGTVDLAREAETLPTTDRATLKRSIHTLIEKSGISEVPIELWIDEHHLLRKMTMDIAEAAGVHTDLTLEFFDFGAIPSVTAPSGGETFDATQSAIGDVLGG